MNHLHDFFFSFFMLTIPAGIVVGAVILAIIGLVALFQYAYTRWDCRTTKRAETHLRVVK